MEEASGKGIPYKGPLKKQAVSSKETLCNFAASFFQKTGHSKLARFFALPVNHFFLSVLPQKDACPAGLSGGPPLWYAGSPSGAGMALRPADRRANHC